jgi:hypothetical protein
VVARSVPAPAERIWWSFHAPTGDGDRLRLAAAAAAYGAFFPREPLRAHLLTQVPLSPGSERTSRRAAAARDRGGPALSNGDTDDDRHATLAWTSWPDAVGPARTAFADVVLSVPRVPFAVFAAEDLTFRLAAAIQPWHGRVHTTASARAVRGQCVENPASVRLAAPFGLPHLYYDPARRHPLVPLEVTWINVWSADTCEVLGFRPADERLFSAVRSTSDGARVLSLATLPLDPATEPEHVRALRAVYERFPRIGSRD